MSEPAPAAHPPPNEEKIRDLKAEIYDLSKVVQMYQQQAQKTVRLIEEKEQRLAEMEQQK